MIRLLEKKLAQFRNQVVSKEVPVYCYSCQMDITHQKCRHLLHQPSQILEIPSDPVHH